LCTIAALAAACGAPEVATPRASTRDPSPASDAGRAAPSSSEVEAPPAPPGAPSQDEAPLSAPLTVTFRRVLDAAVSAIALERPPHAAALGAASIWVHDAKGWRAEPLPASARPARGVDVAIFYGRDHRVRVMGTRTSGGEPQGVYLRWLPGGFRADSGEIGKLASPKGGLLGVLGIDDPEIVCRPGDICIIKRVSGWTMIAAPEDLRRVALGAGVGWGIAGRKLVRLGGAWEVVGPPGAWEAEGGLFATKDRAWVIETTRGRIHLFDGATWQVLASPLANPRGGSATSAESVWLVGDGGLAHFNGKVWRVAKDAPGPLAAIATRGDQDVWVGGARGLFHVE